MAFGKGGSLPVSNRLHQGYRREVLLPCRKTARKNRSGPGRVIGSAAGGVAAAINP
jgi:hypothetical protein